MDRCYRKALPDAAAMDMLRAEGGRAFDPRVVDTFIAGWAEFVALRDAVTLRSLTFADLVRGPVELALP